LKQAALQAESAWVNSVSDYQQQIDELKIELGISVDTPIVLKEDVLTDLKIIDPKVSHTQASQVALGLRPDLWSAVDRVEDASRRIEVAKIDLRAGLDVVGEYEIEGATTGGAPKLDLDRRNWSAGLDIDLPFDRKEQRNNYRAAFVSLEQSKRDRELAFDQVRLQVNNDWRALSQAKRNYEINVSGIKVARIRLREQEIRKVNGNAIARDIVEARRDLIDAQNAASSSMVDHTLARLRLWQDMGILYITEDGSWIRVLRDEGDRDE
jgi:outer membrane protein TolC